MNTELNREQMSCLFEGMTSLRAVIRGIESGVSDRRIEEVLFDRSIKKKKARELFYVNTKSKELGFRVSETDGDYISSVASGTTHGGIIFTASGRTLFSLDNSKIVNNGFYVMLEGIEDPYNFGYALRSIYAAGADGIILSPRNWMSAAGVVCRSSAGASELFSVFESDGASAAKFFSGVGYKIVCAGIRDSVSAFDADLKKPIFLIVGGEKRGISSGLLSYADITVRLDYGREFRQSLSSASAASILAYEILRQNRS